MAKTKPNPKHTESKGDLLQIRLSPEEKRGFKAAAEIAGIDLSSWVRERLRSAAKSELEDAAQAIPFLPNPSAH